jgi:hypothetical protein
LRFFRFPNKALTRITDDYVFKQVRVAHGFLCLLLKNARRVKEIWRERRSARARVQGKATLMLLRAKKSEETSREKIRESEIHITRE